MDKLMEMTEKYPQTRYWNDSCSIDELTYALKRGAVGATTNPVIVYQVLSNNLERYSEYIKNQIKKYPLFSEDEIAQSVIEQMACDGAKLLLPRFNDVTGEGRLSIQTNTKYFKNSSRLLEQTLHFTTLAQNIQVKIPTTLAGLATIEEATYNGVSINATVSFTATQAIAAAEAVERGLARRVAQGKSIDGINPVITIMVGRLDDYLKDVAKNNDLIPNVISHEALNYAGIACAKKAYFIFKERNFKSKILIAAYRNQHHWLDFIGGDLIMTIPYSHQVKFNESNEEIISMIDEPVSEKYISELMQLEDFKKAYISMAPEEFDHYGAVIKTLRQFAEGYDNLVKIIREFILVSN